uniref:Thioredoxin domain-containing protein n=1 Tax=Panagrolaimus sp. JU765 TaxID=591449 RepID=A0AC34QUX8_9BILA
MNLAAASFLIFVLLQNVFASSVEVLNDHGSFKSLIKSRNNVLIFFNNVPKTDDFYDLNWKVLNEAGASVKGIGTVAFIDCTSKDGQKLCKLLKTVPEKNLFSIKYYKNGEFNKYYDRTLAADTIRRFLKDPDGPVPYADEPEAANVLHPEKQDDFFKILKIAQLPVLALFYAPWCQHCKQLKPTFNVLADKVRGKAFLVAVDLTIEENNPLMTRYNVEAYPTLILFKKDKRYAFKGERTLEALEEFINDPTAKPKPKTADVWFQNSDVVPLFESNINEFIKENPSVAVMFYAPWCGHSKNVKPEFEAAARKIKNEGLKTILAALDATIFANTAKAFNVTSYPTFMLFKKGKFDKRFDYRTKDAIVDFVKENEGKLGSKPVKKQDNWDFENTNVLPLNGKVFDQTVSKADYSFVMYYSPTCSHCESARPQFFETSQQFASNKNILFGAVNCLVEADLCKKREIYGYPTFEFLKNGQNKERYTGARNTDNFVFYLNDKMTNDKLEDNGGFEFAANIAIATPETFSKLVKEGKHLVLYFKPEDETVDGLLKEFNDASTITKFGAFLVVDCTNHADFCKEQRVYEFPLLKIFEDGKFKRIYNDGNTKEMFISSLSDKPYVPPLDFGEYVKMGTNTNFAELISKKKSLVLFYASWCNHCKLVKPEFVKASKRFKSGLFIAVDCGIYQVLCKNNEIKSYPILKLFKKGELFSEYYGPRSADGFIAAFSKTKDELMPEDGKTFKFPESVNLGNESNFEDLIKEEKTLVMFYAPWCGHCQNAKPEFIAASLLQKEGKYAAVDCTEQKSICEKYEVTSYPTFLIFKNGKKLEQFQGERNAKGFGAVFDAKSSKKEKKKIYQMKAFVHWEIIVPLGWRLMKDKKK